MKKFIPREKLGKKAKRQLDREARVVWQFSPASRRIDSKKRYDRKRSPKRFYDDGGDLFSYNFLTASTRATCG